MLKSSNNTVKKKKREIHGLEYKTIDDRITSTIFHVGKEEKKNVFSKQQLHFTMNQ